MLFTAFSFLRYCSQHPLDVYAILLIILLEVVQFCSFTFDFYYTNSVLDHHIDHAMIFIHIPPVLWGRALESKDDARSEILLLWSRNSGNW